MTNDPDIGERLVMVAEAIYDGRARITLAECGALMSEAGEALTIAQAIADESSLSLIDSHGARVMREGFEWLDLTEEQQLFDFLPELAYLEGRGLIERDPANPLLVRVTPD